VSEEKKNWTDSDRPSRHGQLLGETLALLADLGERDIPFPLPPRCSTCAFRRGSLPNQTAATGIIALNCTLGVDKDRFACHHGMRNGEPSKLCIGYLAAREAPFSLVKQIMQAFAKDLATISDDSDQVRSAFDVWAREVDPDGNLDCYALAREWGKRRDGGGASAAIERALVKFETGP
jgi:hypothetical protein